MGEVERNSLDFWGRKVVSDPTMLPQDPRGIKLGDNGFLIKPGEHCTTFCNVAAARICAGARDRHDFDLLDADQIHDKLTGPKSGWSRLIGTLGDRMKGAHDAAMLGDLAVLSFDARPHGHVVVVAPAKPMLYSGKWACYSPQVFNVGGPRPDGSLNNGIVGANYAFGEPPDVFVLGEVLS